jgi:hypothetical protein
VRLLWLLHAASYLRAVPNALQAASLDLADAPTHYESVRAGYGHVFLDQVQNAFDFIDQFPHLGLVRVISVRDMTKREREVYRSHE